MKVETVITCPLGSKCQEVVDGKMHQCAWFIELKGKNPQTGDEIDEGNCAMAWQPILLIENSSQTRDVARSVQDLRNRTLEQQKKAIEVIQNAESSSS